MTTASAGPKFEKHEPDDVAGERGATEVFVLHRERQCAGARKRGNDPVDDREAERQRREYGGGPERPGRSVSSSSPLSPRDQRSATPCGQSCVGCGRSRKG